MARVEGLACKAQGSGLRIQDVRLRDSYLCSPKMQCYYLGRFMIRKRGV